MHKSTFVVLLLAGGASGAWLERDTLRRVWQSHVNPPKPVQTQVYGWQDKHGVWHYSSTKEDKRAQVVVVDTGKITRIQPPPPTLPKIDAKKMPDPLDIKGLREDLIEQQQKMQEAREKQALDEGR